MKQIHFKKVLLILLVLLPCIFAIAIFAQNEGESELIIPDTPDAVVYNAHSADIGWMDKVLSAQTAGTVGLGKQMESISIEAPNIINLSADSNIVYNTHVSYIGWLDEVSNGAESGTTGRSLSIESFYIKLTGEAANEYDIYYRAHLSNFGWLDWTKNGEKAGTEGLGKSLEAYEVIMLPKGSAAPGNTEISYFTNETFKDLLNLTSQASVENVGWIDSSNNQLGTQGQNQGIEAVRFNINNLGDESSISYNLYVEDIGWVQDQSNDEIAGTVGQDKQAEAICIALKGIAANNFDIYYRAHVEDYGWLGWAKNGEIAGTSGGRKKLEAVEIKVQYKNEPAPTSDNDAYIEIKDKLTAADVPNFNLICAIVQHEGGASYESALAVMSCVMNRCDSGRWGGTDPVSVLTAPGQFASYLGGYYRQFLNNPAPAVQQAVLDCLNGTRSHPYQSFRSYATRGSVCIGGNWYF